MQAIEALKHEHRVIEHGIGVLEAIARRLERNEEVVPEHVEALLDFFRDFADGCHHAKEEQALFPTLESRGLPREGGPIGVMLMEHEEGRNYQRTLREALSGLERPEMRERFIQAARGYAMLLRDHIRKEDEVLFVMADQVLSPEDDASLLDTFDRHEKEKMGEGVHERLHQLIHDLAAMYETEAGESNHEQVIDVRLIPPPQRHPLIFQTFDALAPGEAFILVNDHDPKPLYYQFMFEREGQFSWEYLEQGPEVWRVRIAKV